jgi:hypothetical protein
MMRFPCEKNSLCIFNQANNDNLLLGSITNKYYRYECRDEYPC